MPDAEPWQVPHLLDEHSWSQGALEDVPQLVDEPAVVGAQLEQNGGAEDRTHGADGVLGRCHAVFSRVTHHPRSFLTLRGR
jgi:hypothetical protein